MRHDPVTFAKAFGIVFLLVGLSGFIPGATTQHSHPGANDVVIDAGLGAALGLFPVNILHNLFHVVFGIWGLAAARSRRSARLYGKSVAVIYTALAIFGLIPTAKLWTTFGMISLYGNDVWLHILLAAVAGYFGFVHREHTGDATAGDDLLTGELPIRERRGEAPFSEG